jgi:hypothetical protein
MNCTKKTLEQRNCTTIHCRNNNYQRNSPVVCNSFVDLVFIDLLIKDRKFHHIRLSWLREDDALWNDNKCFPIMCRCYVAAVESRNVINFKETGFVCLLTRDNDKSMHLHDWPIYNVDSKTQWHFGETRNFMAYNGDGKRQLCLASWSEGS